MREAGVREQYGKNIRNKRTASLQAVGCVMSSFPKGVCSTVASLLFPSWHKDPEARESDGSDQELWVRLPWFIVHSPT